MQFYYVKILIIASIADLVHLQPNKANNKEETTSLDDFKVINSAEKTVTVICQKDLWTKFPKVKLNSPFASTIVFENCTYPTTMNMPNILHMMKIKQTFLNEITLKRFHSIPHRRNFQGLSILRLNLQFYSFTEMPFDLLYDVANLRRLEIKNTQIRSIPEGFFSDWAWNVTEIRMNKNKLQKIAKHYFQRLVNVKVLFFLANDIRVIEPGAFDGLTSLIHLELGSNSLRTLPPGIFHQTTNLMVLGASYNSFDEFSEDLLANTKNLKYFSMFRNDGTLATLPRGFFKNIIHLKNVEIVITQLEDLPRELFAGCSTLERIILPKNRLTSLPLGLFGDTRNLHYLDISKNRLQSLPAGIFKGLNNLKIINMESNQLTTLMPEVLEGLQSVINFKANNNNLIRIHKQFMSYLKSATTIDLSYNRITFESQSRTEFFKYQNESLESNKNLDTSIELKYSVDLTNNMISKFNSDLVNILRYSEYVHLDNNPISEIDLFELPPTLLAIRNDTRSQYVSVFIRESSLRCDCNIIDFVHYLNVKNERSMYKISYQEFVTQRHVFKCASPAKFKNQDISKLRLQELSCLWKSSVPDDACNESCDCQEYPEKKFLTVDCSHRNLTRMPSLIGNTHNFSIELNMTGNMLQHISTPKGSYLVNVRSLDLSYNNITKITIDLFSPKLQQLRLHGNNLSRLDSDVINHLSGNNISSRNITLHDNKWICDCKADKLLAFVQSKFASRFDEIRCYGSHQKLYEMTAIELCKDLIIIIVTSCLLITLLGIMVASSIVLYHKYEREIKTWLYSKQLCLWFVTEDELDKDKEYDAFISFSQKDEHFVEKEIVAKLEEGPRPCKLCLHYQDWLAGEWIPIQISRSVEASRRTIVILTPNFLESVWGLLEFRTAHIQALKDGRARLIVIIYGDIGNIDDLDQEMKDYLRLNTYIKWGDPWFWDKLRYALPHSKEFLKRKTGKTTIVENHLLKFSSANNSGANSSELFNDSTKNENLMSSC